MAHIHALDTGAEARGYVIEVLRDLLAQAEAGAIRSVHACVVSSSDGTMERHSAGDYSVFEIIAAVEVMKHSLIANNVRE